MSARETTNLGRYPSQNIDCVVCRNVRPVFSVEENSTHTSKKKIIQPHQLKEATSYQFMLTVFLNFKYHLVFFTKNTILINLYI